MRRHGRRRGVSLLLEALVGIGLFGTCLLVVFGLFPSTHRSLAQARHYTEAVNLAQRYVGDSRARPYDSSLLNYSVLLPIQGTVDGVAVETTYNVTVAEGLVGAPPDDLKSVRVTVSWEEGQIQRQVTVETAVTP